MEKIQYYLTNNPFDSSSPSAKQNRYIAKVKKQGIVYQEELVEEMLKKNTSLTRQDILAVISLMKESLMEKIHRGYAVHTELFRAGTSIKGDFKSLSDKFDPEKHRLCFSMKAPLDLQKEIESQAAVQQVRQEKQQPLIRSIYRFEENRSSHRFLPGDLVEIHGRAFIAEKNLEVLLTEDDSSYSLEIHRISERRILCNIPADIPPGSYTLLVIQHNALTRIPVQYPTEIQIQPEKKISSD